MRGRWRRCLAPALYIADCNLDRKPGRNSAVPAPNFRNFLATEEPRRPSDERTGFLEGEHVAAVVEDFEASAGDVLGVIFADGQRKQLVVAAPEDERWRLDAVEMLWEAGVVKVRVPGDAGRGFAGAEPLE